MTNKDYSSGLIFHEKRPCRFHGSAKGCSRGTNCRFSHQNPNLVPYCRDYIDVKDFYVPNCDFRQKCKYRHKICNK